MREKASSAIVFHSSTNKVYGGPEGRAIKEGDLRYCLADRPIGRPLKIYGNGKQVRDVLFIDDLVGAYEGAAQHIAPHRAAEGLQKLWT